MVGSGIFCDLGGSLKVVLPLVPKDEPPGGSVIIISAPNENSQKASKSVNVLAAGSQDRICVNEHQN